MDLDMATERRLSDLAPPHRSTLRRGEGRHNLLARLTSFVGRDRDVAEVQRLLATTRLLTLTGAGGIGKTRLALEAAAALTPSFADGVWLVKLASLADPALFGQTIATTLGVRVPSDRPLLDTLLEYLRHRELLLLLDNCEHLVTACASLTETLLQGCPDLRVLVTSRQALGITGETVWRVPPLAAPDLEPLPASGAVAQPATGGEPFLARYGAVRLFVDRAMATLPGFELTAQNGRAVAQVCQQLDGIPLAIELAAARVGLLTPEQIAARLSDRFRLLTGGSSTALPRHQTLRSLVDWSYDLLDAAEQALLRRLAVFAGGWTLDAAEVVCGGVRDEGRGDTGMSAQPIFAARSGHGRSDRGARDELEPHPLDRHPAILDVLGRLLMKSLVVAEEWRGEVRYRLLQTIREYAGERLRQAGEEAALRERHRDWFLALAERTAPELSGPRGADLYDRLEVEQDNFWAALEWSVANPASDKGLRLAVALHQLWSLRGLQTEGREWLARMLTRTTGRTAARARALNTAAYLALRQGDYAAALPLLGESLPLARELGDTAALAAGHQYRGLVLHGQGEYAQAALDFEESLTLARALGEHSRVQAALQYLADMAYEQGDFDRATALYEECLAVARELNNDHNISGASRGLGLVALGRADLERAVPLLEDALVRSHGLGDKKCAPRCVEALARVAVSQGRAERAARLFGAAQALRDAIPTVLFPAERADHERDLATVRADLTDERFNRAWSEGQAMTFDQAAEYALVAADPDSRTTEPPAADDPLSRLTPREREVVALIARGLTNSQIAADLVLSIRTVERHIENIYDKLGVRGKAARAAVATYALESRRAEAG
jgi:predicted ATPase/DNA-binding CsgD family transcriptional regulator